MAGAGDKINETNKRLLKQLELLRESANISNSSLDSLKEALGIQQRRSTAEADLLKTSNEINRAIQNQEVGLESISSIQNQIAKNQKLINKGKLTEKGLEESLGGQLSKKAKLASQLSQNYSKVESIINSQNQALARGEKIDINKLNKLKESQKSRAALLDLTMSQLNPLEQQAVAIKVQNQELEKQNQLRQKELESEKKIEKKLGIVGGILKGINKIPILGDVFDASKASEDMKNHLREGGSAAGALAVGIKNVSKQMWDGVWNTSNLIVGAFTMMVSIFKDLDGGAGDYAKSMNVSYSEAMATRGEMQDLAISTNDAAINSKRLMESQMAISKEIGSTAELNKADLVTMTAMVRKMGLTHKEAAGIQKLSLLNGKSLEKNNKLIVGAAKAQASKNKLVINEKDVLREVSKASAALTLSLGNNPAELAKAVVQAKEFGLTLEQADKIAGSLLNFEQSIENELSAELLTGKDLNFEKARQLALNNDIAGAAEEVAKQVGTSADFAKMNRIQQEAIAKAAGLGREELAKSLMDKEALAKMSEVEGASAQEKYNNLRKTMSAEEAAEKLGDEKMAKMYEQQSVQDKFNDSMEQLKEMLANDLMPIFEGLANFLREHMNLIKPIVKAFLTIKGIMMAINALQSLRNTLMAKEGMIALKNKAKQIGGFMVGVGKYAVNAAASAAQTPIVGPLLAIAALGAAFAGGYALKSYFSQGDDVMSPGYGDRTLFGPEGAIQLNNKDTVIAGTNLFGDDVKSEPGKSTEMTGKGGLQANSNGNMAAVVSAVSALGAKLDELAARPINVQVGEEVVIKAAVGNDPKVTGDEMGKNSYQLN